MKKIVSIIICCALFSLSAIGLSACDENQLSAGTHEHTYATEWTNDELFHWHVCTYADCKEVSGKAPHDFVELTEEDKLYRQCSVCNYKEEITAEAHEHTFSEDWSVNEQAHWHACTFNNCKEKIDLEEHSFNVSEIAYSDNSMTTTYICEVAVTKRPKRFPLRR